MNEQFTALLFALQRSGWVIELKETPSLELPAKIVDRFPYFPGDLHMFLNVVKSCVNARQTAWLLCEDDYNGENSRSAFSWDDFERMSVQAAQGQPDWLGEIDQFWRRYLPIAQSVQSGYAYLAMDMSDPNTSTVIYGREPEFEEPGYICGSFEQLIRIIAGVDAGPEVVILDFPGTSQSVEGAGYHPHSLTLGGPAGQNLTQTGETQSSKNPNHSEATDIHIQVARVIKLKQASIP